MHTIAVVFVNGRRRDPYPPATVSLLTNPLVPFKSANTTRMIVSRRKSHQTSDRARPQCRCVKRAAEAVQSNVRVGGPRGAVDLPRCAEDVKRRVGTAEMPGGA